MRYECTACDRTYDIGAPRWRCDCGGPLDLSSPAVTRDLIDTGGTGVWRYRRLLPPVDPGRPISLGEPTTPLIDAGNGALLKLDYLLPSGSYKDRGATVMVSRLTALGIGDIVLDSSGNAGAAVSTYSARAGISCQVFVPAGNSASKLAQIAAVGGRLRPVHGSRADATLAAIAASDGSFYGSHNWSADFLAGLSTMAFEIWEQLGGRAPTSVLAPCGNGGVILGLYRGFEALYRGGLIDRIPPLVAVQSAAFSGVAKAVDSGSAEPSAFSHGTTIAEGIACELPVRGRQLVRAIVASGGTAVTVTDDDIRDAALRLASCGCYVEPTGAVGYAGLLRLSRGPRADLLGTSTVAVLTGSGLKAGRKIADLRAADWWPAEA